ncbi:hypothetical protein AB833_30855 [Chromatiales bacterium (ex Bugula neritina AB1)]|nr:hypothetical protein AB833_30855 [Chromatiales bacterium (ex Bugula neritina AB1)]
MIRNSNSFLKVLLLAVALPAVDLLVLASGLQPVQAQTAPSAREAAAYDGLHLAAFRGDTAAAAKLIAAKADIEARDSSGRTPVIVAAHQSHEAIVRLLMEAGAYMNAMDYQAYDAVTIAAVANDLPMLDLVLTLDASAANITSPYDGTALIAAAHLGHDKIVKRLIEAKAPLDHVNNLKWTALIEAVVLGDGGPAHTETVRLLLEAGADRTIGDSQGITPLEHAKSRHDSEMVELLK